MKIKEHNRNQKRMYRIHKQEEKIQELELLVGKLKQENKHLDEVNCKLRKTNEQLKNNWNELKEWASNFYNSEEVGWAGCGMRYTLEKIQELEQGSDSDAKD
jgi:predicted RNase H-like nuclease (RuvC/YqgF family)